MKVAFVPPRYGGGVVGGSEALTREAAIGLSGRGWEVEILTTCATDHYTWENSLSPGVSSEDGLVVRRFPTVREATSVGRRAQEVIEAGGRPTLDEQTSWLGLWFRVPDLFHHLVAHGEDYDAVVFSPYLFWTTSVGLGAVRERAVVVPCLHDEPYARLDVLRPVLSEPAEVWFLSEPEHQLAHRLGPVAPRHEVTGAGVHVPAHYDPEGFRARHGIERPFVLFAGRREGGKGWDWLLDAFGHAVREGGLDLDLVTLGVGRVETLSSAVSDRVIDLGFLDAGDRDDAFAAATVYVQASRMESFSRTTMEAWLAGTPVVARSDSEVVAWHCERSGGGTTFADVGELVDCLRVIVDRPETSAAMAAKGREYVLANYTWEVVLDRMQGALEDLLS